MMAKYDDLTCKILGRLLIDLKLSTTQLHKTSDELNKKFKEMKEMRLIDFDLTSNLLFRAKPKNIRLTRFGRTEAENYKGLT